MRSHRAGALRNLEVSGTLCTFDVTKPHLANSLRRALLSRVRNVAPSLVRFQRNTSCQNDEYIAHRIGLIPFVSDVAAPSPATLDVTGRTVYSRDLVSPDATVTCGDIPILLLHEEQRLQLSVEFAWDIGATHARFSHVSAVSFAEAADGKSVRLSFDNIAGAPPLPILRAALDALVAMVDDASSVVSASVPED